MTHITGEWGLRILLLSLVITPLAKITKSGWMVQFRRMIGLYAFFYGILHFFIYLLFDLSFDFGFLIEDIIERPYITVGFAALVILVALAVTSPLKIRHRMANSKITWKQLHRTTYLATILVVVHFLWITRVDDVEPLVYGGIAAVLLGYRIFSSFSRSSRT